MIRGNHIQRLVCLEMKDIPNLLDTAFIQINTALGHLTFIHHNCIHYQ
jgi:hypothetical protein